MNKRLMFALLLAVASGSSVVAMDGNQPADKGFGSKAKDAASTVLNAGVIAGMVVGHAGKEAAVAAEKLVTWPVRMVVSERIASGRTNFTKHSPRVAHLALTAALGYVGWKNETVKSFLKKVTKPITSRCCKDKK